MRIIIKPAGLFTLITVIALLSCLIFFGSTRPQAVDVAQSTPVDSAGDLYAGGKWAMTPGDDADKASMKERSEAVPGTDDPVKVYAIKIQRPMANPWDVNLYLVTPAVITRGERLQITFRARSADRMPFLVNFERYGEPYTKSVSQEIKTTGEWRQYTVDFTAVESYPAEKSYTTFQCGLKKGTLEIADVHLVRVPNLYK